MKFSGKRQRCKAVFSGLAKNWKIGKFRNREKSPLRARFGARFRCYENFFKKFCKKQVYSLEIEDIFVKMEKMVALDFSCGLKVTRKALFAKVEKLKIFRNFKNF